MYTNKKQYVNHLHLFGAKCFVLKDGEENLSKFEPKAYEKIFVGYTNSAYRVFEIDTLSVKVSVNVTFDDIKLPSLQSANPSESLMFDNYPDSDSDDNMPPEVTT